MDSLTKSAVEDRPSSPPPASIRSGDPSQEEHPPAMASAVVGDPSTGVPSSATSNHIDMPQATAIFGNTPITFANVPENTYEKHWRVRAVPESSLTNENICTKSIALKNCYDTIKPLRNGDLLVQVSSLAMSRRLQEVKKIGNTLVHVTSDIYMNCSRGVVTSSEFTGLSNEELNQTFSSIAHTVKRLPGRFVDGQRLPSNSLLITFKNPTTPTSIKVGYMYFKVKTFFPFPTRCFKCNMYGHSAGKCRKEATCGWCSKEVQEDEDHPNPCSNPKCCLHCKGPHPVWDRECIKFKREKELVEIMTLNKKIRREAISQWEQDHPTSKFNDISQEMNYAQAAGSSDHVNRNLSSRGGGARGRGGGGRGRGGVRGGAVQGSRQVEEKPAQSPTNPDSSPQVTKVPPAKQDPQKSNVHTNKSSSGSSSKREIPNSSSIPITNKFEPLSQIGEIEDMEIQSVSGRKRQRSVSETGSNPSSPPPKRDVSETGSNPSSSPPKSQAQSKMKSEKQKIKRSRHPLGDEHEQIVDDTLYFHGGNSVFSNFHECQFGLPVPQEVVPEKFKDKHPHDSGRHTFTFKNSETLYQFRKAWAFQDKGACKKILNASSGREAKKISHNIKGHSDGKARWHEKLAIGVMSECVYRKFALIPELKQKLLDAPSNLVEASDTDSFWGSGSADPGGNHIGQNMLGCILMSLREFFLSGEKSSGKFCFSDIKERVEWECPSLEVTF